MTIMRVADEIKNAIIKNRRLRVAIVKGYWKEIVGRVFQKSDPLYEKDKTLFVVVEDTMYAHHMMMNKVSYIEKINKLLQGEYIEDIRFKIGNVLKRESEELKIEEKKIEEEILEERDKKIDENLSIEEKIEILKKYSKDKELKLLKKGYKRCHRCGTFFLGEGDICIICSNTKDKNKGEH